jgi:hypothetical protein
MRSVIATLLAGLTLAAGEAAAQWTETPGTAPVGGLRVEIEALSLATDRHTLDRDGVTYRSALAGSVFLSTGVTPTWDIQLGVDLWRKESAVDEFGSSTESGRGDLWLRAKWNFAGDENEGPTWAVLPYVKVPTAADGIGNDAWEPGVLLVFGRPLGESRSWQVNAGLDWLDDGAGGCDVYFSVSSALTHWLNGRWGIYGEVYAWSDASILRDASVEIGVGVTCAVGETGWVELACYVGVTRVAVDYTPALRCGWDF